MLLRNLKPLTVPLFLATFLANCAHHRDVRPGEDGIHTVILKSEDEDGSYREAKAQADHYCEQFKKAPIVLKEGSKYKGEMDEKTYKQTKSFARGAKAVGTVALFGNDTIRNAGGAAVLAGSGADAYAGEGYSYKMRFKCKKSPVLKD